MSNNNQETHAELLERIARETEKLKELIADKSKKSDEK